MTWAEAFVYAVTIMCATVLLLTFLGIWMKERRR